MRCRPALHAQGWLASGAQNIAAWLSGSRTQEPIILHRDAVSGGGYAHHRYGDQPGPQCRLRPLRRVVGSRGEGGHRFRRDFSISFGHRRDEGTPNFIDSVCITVRPFPSAMPLKAGINDRTDPLSGRMETNLHERFGPAAA